MKDEIHQSNEKLHEKIYPNYTTQYVEYTSGQQRFPGESIQHLIEMKMFTYSHFGIDNNQLRAPEYTTFCLCSYII